MVYPYSAIRLMDNYCMMTPPSTRHCTRATLHCSTPDTGTAGWSPLVAFQTKLPKRALQLNVPARRHALWQPDYYREPAIGLAGAGIPACLCTVNSVPLIV